MKSALVLLFSIAVLLVSGRAEDKSPAEAYRLPKDAVDALSSGTEFVLYSLDPGPIPSMEPRHLKPEEDFYGFKVLGRLPLTDLKARSVAVAAVIEAIHRADYHYLAKCFYARHALRVTAGDRVFDFVICYQCGQIRLYEKGAYMASIGIPSAPDALNKLLSEAGIPLAKPPPKEHEN